MKKYPIYQIKKVAGTWILTKRDKPQCNWSSVAVSNDLFDVFKHIPKTAGLDDKAIFNIEVV